MKKRFHNKHFYFSVLLSGVLTYLLDIIYFQSPSITRRESVFCLVIFLITFFLIFLLVDKYFSQRFIQNPHKTSLVVSSIILATLTSYVFSGLIFDWRIIPSQTIVVKVLAESNPASTDHQVRLDHLESNFGVLSFNELEQNPDWIRTSKSLLENSGNQESILKWEGRPGAFVKFTFLTGPDAGIVRMHSVNGDEQIDLFAAEPGEITWEDIYPIPFHAYLIPIVAIWIFLFSGYFFLLFVVLPFSERKEKIRTGYWLLFSLPMLLVWTFYLLTFWPGEMSPDSIVQWGQILTGRFTDTHPAIHTMLLWLITRMWLSPAPIAILQIIVVCFSVAWGMKTLLELGINLPAAWLIAIVFALSPINSTMVISIWKDIPYGVALFLFSIQCLKIIISNGKWLSEWQNIMAMVFAGLCVMLFRHNGIPVPILSLVVLAIIYRPVQIKFGVIIMCMLVSWWFIRGPFYDLVGVSKIGGLENAQITHHIAAHIIKGNSLTEEEQRIANTLLPNKNWGYNCCRIDETMGTQGFSWVRISENSKEANQLFFKLLLKEPSIDLQDLVCSSQIVWSINSSCGMVVTRTISHNRQITDNPYGLFPQSKIPTANEYLTNLYNTAFFISKLQFYWYPAIYLTVLIVGSILLSIWKKIKKGYLFCVPAIIQSIILALVSLNAGDFRYQYGVYLLGLFSLGLLIISINTRFEEKVR